EVVHGDIEPAHVHVPADGPARLDDLGLAPLMHGPAYPGSSAHASPEQLAGNPPTAASDVFSLGPLLYHSLTRHRPGRLPPPPPRPRAWPAPPAPPPRPAPSKRACRPRSTSSACAACGRRRAPALPAPAPSASSSMPSSPASPSPAPGRPTRPSSG